MTHDNKQFDRYAKVIARKQFNVRIIVSKMELSSSSKRKWPLLRKIRSSAQARPDTPDLLRDLVQRRRFDDSPASSVSDLTDVFEDVHKGKLFCIYPKLGKKLSKIDYDKLTFQEFTKKFRETMKGLRKDMAVEDDNDNMLTENIDDIVQILQREQEDQPLSDGTREETERILRDEDYIEESPSLGFENVDYTIRRQTPETYDVLSGVWNMLATNCEQGKFAVTYPNFDAFQTRHWLQTEPLAWQVADESKAKCEKWLNEQCE